MKEWATKQWQTALVWKLAITKAILFSLVTLGSAWQVATAGLKFGQLDYWDRVGIVVGIFVLWGNQMMAFFDKTAANINAGRPPIGQESTGNTELLPKPSNSTQPP